ncbi:MAG: O-antigen ligase family protein [Chloroflexi bacterium]|nr:O-antigen ligase family protein [Chloroflexota bacterium]MDA8188050.1 O-antigen ligase family protein [Dehalococcoidales bacterium]
MALEIRPKSDDALLETARSSAATDGITSVHVARLCDRVTVAGLLLLFVGIPLAYGGLYTYDMFDLPKLVYMRAVSIIVLAAWLLGSLARRGFTWRGSALDLPVFAFAIANLLATIHSVSPNLSIHGEYRRYEGIYTIANYLLLFFFVTNLLRWRVWASNPGRTAEPMAQENPTPAGPPARRIGRREVAAMSTVELLKALLREIKNLVPRPRNVFSSKSRKGGLRQPFGDVFEVFLVAQVVAGGLIAAYGILQHLGRDFVVFNPHGPSPVISTFGNVNFLAAYLIMAIPLGIGLLLLASSLVKKALVGLCLLLMTITLFYTTARGAWLGLAVALALMALMLGRKVLVRNMPLIVIVVALVVIPASANFDTLSQRIQGIFAGGANTVQFRIDWWRSLTPLIADNIFLGTGVSALEVVFTRYSSLEYAQGQGQNTFLDKAHNEFLHLASTTGLVGLGAYLLILTAFAVLVWNLRKQWMHGDSACIAADETPAPASPQQGSSNLAEQPHWREARRIYVISLTAAIVAYLVQNQFSFGVIGIASVFWMMLGMVAVLARDRSVDAESLGAPSIPDREFHLRLPFKSEVLQSLGLAIVLVAVAGFMLNLRVLEADNLYRQARMDNEARDYDAAIAKYKRIVELNPYQTEYWRGLSEVYADKAMAVGDQLGAKQRKDEILDQSVAALKKATELNPAAFHWLMLAEAYRAFDNNSHIVQAYQSYRKAVEVYPYYLPANKGLADTAYQLRLYPEAERAYQMVTLLDPRDVDAYIGLALAYTHTGKEDEQLATWKKVILLDPNRYSAHFYLGSLYEKRGLKQEAVEEYNQVLAIVPKPEQVADYNGIKQRATEALARLGK